MKKAVWVLLMLSLCLPSAYAVQEELLDRVVAVFAHRVDHATHIL